MAKFTEVIRRDYGITKRPITAQNPQANGINMLHTFQVHSTKLDKDDPWSGILGAVMFATRAT
eukprot:3985438-Ditylum_brightwellii.AAC.1